MAGPSRWCGALRVESGPFIDTTPIFKVENDPYVVRFNVSPIFRFDVPHAIPVTEPEIWQRLTWTKDIVPGSVGWGANFQRSLRVIPQGDGQFLFDLLKKQAAEQRIYPLSARDERHVRATATVRTPTGELEVKIPDSSEEVTLAAGVTEQVVSEPSYQPRESHRIQALVCEIGAKMGFKLWCPRADRERVIAATATPIEKEMLDVLPLNYNEATVRTIEQIDVLWIRGRAIVRAFEVEHTTAIYSGILRMADLVALQPNMTVPMHIVAPVDRRDSVLEQIGRPVFALLETGPLAERCTLITYDAIEELAALPHLRHVTDTILGEYQESA